MRVSVSAEFLGPDMTPADEPRFAIIAVRVAGRWVLLDTVHRWCQASANWRCTRTGEPLAWSDWCWLDTFDPVSQLNLHVNLRGGTGQCA